MQSYLLIKLNLGSLIPKKMNKTTYEVQALLNVKFYIVSTKSIVFINTCLTILKRDLDGPGSISFRGLNKETNS